LMDCLKEVNIIISEKYETQLLEYIHLAIL